MNTLRAKVQESSVALQNYRVKVGHHGAAGAAPDHRQKIMDFNKQYLESQAQRLSAESKMTELQRIANDRGGAPDDLHGGRQPAAPEAQAGGLRARRAEGQASKIYKEKHPEISRSTRRSSR
jgi:hypothetical protein